MSYQRLIRLAIDRLLAPLHKTASIHQLDKILLCNIAHLGDVVIASTIIPALKEALPNAKLGFLCSSSSSCVLEGHPSIEWLHTVDHWKLNRSQINKLKKIATYSQTKKQATSEIQKIGYDVAIDLYPFFPNAVPLLWKTKIPVRIGYVKGGFAPLLTHPIPWKETSAYCLSYHYDLLDQLPISIQRNSFFSTLPKIDALPKKYLLFNMGTAGITKEWPEDHWRRLAQFAKEIPIVFTGKGLREKQRVQRVIQDLPHCLDLCDQLSWKELCSAVLYAQQIVTVDSVIAHLAEMYRIPSIVLIVDPSITTPFWIPPNAIALLKPAPETVFNKIDCLQKEPFGYSRPLFTKNSDENR